MAGPLVESECLYVVRAKHMGHNTAAQHRVQRGGLHWQWPSLWKLWLMHFIIRLLTFAFKKDFKQPFVKKIWMSSNRQASEACDETSSGPVLSSSSGAIYFKHRHSRQWLRRTCTATSCSGRYACQLCVCVMSVCEIYQRIIMKLTVQAFTILCLFLLCFCSVCVSCHSDSLSTSLIKY